MSNIELLPKPQDLNDEELIESVSFAKMFAIIQQEALQMTEFNSEGFKFGFEDHEDHHTMLEAIANKVISEIGIGRFIKFLFGQFLNDVLRNETKFLRMKGIEIQELLAKGYDQADLGYAMSISRSEDGMTDLEINDVITKNTSFTREQYEEIKQVTTSPPKGLGGMGDMLGMMRDLFGDLGDNDDDESDCFCGQCD